MITGTTTPKRISIVATTIDNDGATGICGTPNLNESVIYAPTPNQFLLSGVPPTTQTRTGNTIKSNTTTKPGIDVSPDYANAALYINITELNWTYKFDTTSACTTTGATTNRYGSLNLTCQIDFTPDFDTINLGGNVFNDVNGLNGTPANTVDGTGTNAGGLTANLLDSLNNIVATTTVAANGTYNFTGIPTGATYNVQITSTNTPAVAAGNPALATTLPTGWANTGENFGTGAGSDGDPNGLLQLTIATNAADITTANFGIEQRPTANNNAAPSIVNPGGTNRATVPPTVFTASDTAPGTISSIRITAFPTNATSFTVGTTTYYSITLPGACPTTSCLLFPTVAGVTIPANASGNPTQTDFS